MIELVEPLQEQPLDDHADGADQDRHDNERDPVIQADILQQEERREGAQHVLGAVREVDDVEHAEDDGEAKAQQRVERAVDQPEQQLPEQRLRRNAEDFEHEPVTRCLSPPPERGRSASKASRVGVNDGSRPPPGRLLRKRHPPPCRGREK